MMNTGLFLAVTALLLVNTAASRGQLMEVRRSVPGCPDFESGEFAGGIRGFIGESDRISTLDINDDGIPDQAYYVETAGVTEKMVVVDGTDTSRRWEFQLAAVRPAMAMTHRVIGYYNLDGVVTNENPKEIVFAARSQDGFLIFRLEDVVISSSTLTAGTQPLGIIAILIGLVDVNRDGRTEIITGQCGANPAPVMEVWAWKR